MKRIVALLSAAYSGAGTAACGSYLSAVNSEVSAVAVHSAADPGAVAASGSSDLPAIDDHRSSAAAYGGTTDTGAGFSGGSDLSSMDYHRAAGLIIKTSDARQITLQQVSVIVDMLRLVSVGDEHPGVVPVALGVDLKGFPNPHIDSHLCVKCHSVAQDQVNVIHDRNAEWDLHVMIRHKPALRRARG